MGKSRILMNFINLFLKFVKFAFHALDKTKKTVLLTCPVCVTGVRSLHTSTEQHNKQETYQLNFTDKYRKKYNNNQSDRLSDHQ